MRKIIIVFGAFLLLTAFSFPFTGKSQLFKTSLQVIIRNELGNTENGAKVTLYKNEEDYNASQNPVDSKTTDEKGRVLFEGLEAVDYYIQAEKGDRDNSGAGEKTPKLEAKKLNKVTIVISE